MRPGWLQGPPAFLANLVRRSGVSQMDPHDPLVAVKSLHRPWVQTEERYLELPTGSPEAAHALEGVNQL
jgi:hypothetical protein